MGKGATFGAWLKQQRETRALTQQELAQRIGCATVTLRKIEAGSRRPSRQIAVLVAETFDVPPAEREAFVRYARGDVRAEKSAQDLAPWRAPYYRLPHLSLPTTPLLGRARELAHARAMLLEERVRLLTLTGVGGIGKTRLALQLANDLHQDFPDGTQFVDLSSTTDPGLVLPMIAQAIGLSVRGSRPLFQIVTDYLRDKQMLFVLDNFEQLTPAAPQVGDLLQACPRLQIVVTSRETLGLFVEQNMNVQPLALPNGARLSPEALVRHYPSIALFEQRALAVKPDFAVTVKNAQAVTQVCRQLDGIPLAIELAAARVKVLSAQQINLRLNNRFRLLTTAIGTPPARHLTLCAAVDWSYDLLSDAEKVLFARLSVFAGGWSAEAAEQVCRDQLATDDESQRSTNAHPSSMVLDVLTSLLDKSLVIVSEDSDEPRFRMLETIREYAFERLTESHELSRVRDRHLEYFVELAEEAERKLTGAEQSLWLKRLEQEDDNLRVALNWSTAEARHAILAMRFASALSPYWHFRLLWNAAYEGLKNVLNSYASGERTSERGKALCAVAQLAVGLGLNEEARTLYDEGIDILRGLGEQAQPKLEEALLHYALFLCYSDPTSALRHAEQALRLSRSSGNKSNLARSLNLKMMCQHFKCEFEDALELLDESASLYQEIGNREGLANVQTNIGATFLLQNNLEKANQILERALTIKREIGAKSFVTLFHLANIARLRGAHSEAELLFEQSRENIPGDGYDKSITARILVFESRLRLATGKVEEAERDIRESIALSKETNELVRLPSALETCGFVASTLNDPLRAVRLFGAADTLREKLGTPRPPVEQTEYDLFVTTVMANVGEASFDDAWAEGRSMTIEQAIAYALEDTVMS